MLTLSATCLAIALADKRGTLRLVPSHNPRLAAMGMDGDFVSIEDEAGIIEAAKDMAEAEGRVAALRERANA